MHRSDFRRRRLFVLLNAVVLAVAGIQAGVAADVAFLNSSHDESVLSHTSHNVAWVSRAAVENGILDYFDVLVVGHVAASDWTPDVCTEVGDFLAAGGGLVVEWNGVTVLFDSIDPDARSPLINCGFFAGRVSEGGFLAENVPLSQTGSGDPLVRGLPNPLQLGAGSSWFYEITGLENVWTVAATFSGFTGQTRPALLWAPYGAGCTVAGVFDFFDVLPGNPAAENLISNMVDQSLSCPVAHGLHIDDYESGTLGSWSGITD